MESCAWVLIRPSPSVDPPYAAYGGIFKEQAVLLLQRFYMQENVKGILSTYDFSQIRIKG